MHDKTAREAQQALQRLTKWRRFFASWQLGTRPDTDGEYNAVKHHRELSILIRAELTALTGLLIRKGIITAEEYTKAVTEEAIRLSADYSSSFPGWTATDDGLRMKLPEALDTMKRLGFPP